MSSADPAEALEPVAPEAPRPARAPLPPGPPDAATIRAIIMGLMLAMFLSALEQTIVGPAMPAIGRSLNDIANLSWVVTAYLLSATAVTPLFGKLSDIYGRRAILLISVAIFIIGSVACALAPTMPALIAARALQGIGGGGILPLSQTVIGDLLSPRERPKFQSYSSIMFMGASVLGPLLGGFLTDYMHWSLIFWINVPLGAAALLMTSRALRLLPRHDRPHKLDLIGAALMVAATILLLLALAWGGARYRWTSPEIIGLVGTSIAFWVLFTVRLLKAPEPFIPLSVLKEPLVGAVVTAAFFSIGTVTALSIFVPLYMGLALGFSASGSGVALIAFMVGTVIGAVLTGRLMNNVRHYKRVPITGLVLAAVAMIAFAIDPGGLSVWQVSALLVMAGAGLGPMYPFSTVVIQNGVVPHQMGTATGMLNFFRLLGGAIIVAAFGAIVLGGAELGHGSLLELHPEEARRLGIDFAVAFRFVFITAAVFVGASLVAVLAIKERPLRGPTPALMD